LALLLMSECCIKTCSAWKGKATACRAVSHTQQLGH
jgi:hypothetical protein